MQEKQNKTIKCAIYTRVSTSEGLEQEFTSLDNQRESAENYIQSQKSEGWVMLPEHYNDGGFSGANTERPALKKLLSDIKEGNINCVVVYKVDRLSRSLLDFSQLLKFFDQNNVTFVSVTQAFNTNTSMGRLTLNILLSFAQFEREIISERTRDKMGAAKKKGKWIGGTIPLGYDLDRTCHKLVINQQEAKLVQQIFYLYLEKRSIMSVVSAVNEKGYKTKLHTRPQGKTCGGIRFEITSIQTILKNVLYIGKVSYRNKLYQGEQEQIVSDEIFQKVQEILARNRRKRKIAGRTKHVGLLSQLLHCKACNSVMYYTYSAKARRKYNYYVCLNAAKIGYKTCPTRCIASQAMENKFMDCLRKIAYSPKIQDASWNALILQEKIKIINDIVKQADYDTPSGILEITLKSDGKIHKFPLKIEELKRAPTPRKEIEIAKEPLVRQSLIFAHQINHIMNERKLTLLKISEWVGITHSRICQIVNMLNFSPSIQEKILLSEDKRLFKIPEYKIRPIASEVDWDKQLKLWTALLESIAN